MALVPLITESGPEAVAALAETARAALAELQALSQADRDRRDAAEREVTRWRRLTDEAQRVTALADDLRAAAREAERLAGVAFDEAPRRHAAAVAITALRLANQAEAQAAVLRREATALGMRDDIQQLLREEQEQEYEMEVQETLTLAGGTSTAADMKRPGDC